MLFIFIFVWLNDNWLDFVFSITYEWVQQATVFVLGKPLQPSEMWHSSLMDAYISYRENEVLWLWSHGLYTQHLIFFVTYK